MPLADEMIHRGTALELADVLARSAPDTNFERLLGTAQVLSELKLRERVNAIHTAILEDIGGGYDKLATLIRASLASPAFHGWMIWPVSTAVSEAAVHDGSPAAFDDAMNLLAELTGLLTSEFALRTLLRHDLNRALSQALIWTDSPDEHVRRLASEGTRPYLPWAVRVPDLSASPGLTLPILNRLYRDVSLYVRRSVANHLNDLSRDDPELVVRTAARWLQSPVDSTDWVVRHGLRTLVKRGDPSALELLGYPDPSGALDIEGPYLDRNTLNVGESVELRATMRNVGDREIRLMIDYVVSFHNAAGKQNTKTFKLTTTTLGPGEEVSVRKVHSFRPITPRRYYSGPHAITLQINGVATDPVAFHLNASPAAVPCAGGLGVGLCNTVQHLASADRPRSILQ